MSSRNLGCKINFGKWEPDNRTSISLDLYNLNSDVFNLWPLHYICTNTYYPSFHQHKYEQVLLTNNLAKFVYKKMFKNYIFVFPGLRHHFLSLMQLGQYFKCVIALLCGHLGTPAHPLFLEQPNCFRKHSQELQCWFVFPSLMQVEGVLSTQPFRSVNGYGRFTRCLRSQDSELVISITPMGSQEELLQNGGSAPRVNPSKQHLLPSGASNDYKDQEICEVPPWGHVEYGLACCQVNKG